MWSAPFLIQNNTVGFLCLAPLHYPCQQKDILYNGRYNSDPIHFTSAKDSLMPDQLSEQRFQQLTDALLDAFNHDELTRLIRAQFDQSLEWITPVAGKRDLTTITSDLVVYFASKEGGLKQLLDAAIRENPLNEELNTLGMQWSDLEFAIVPLSAEHPSVNETTINSTSTSVNTDGGAYIGGNVSTGGGEFIGRDKVTHGDSIYGDKICGDKVDGDKVGGDKISATIGDNNSGIAIGKNISQTIHGGVDTAQLNALFTGMLQAAAAAPGNQAEAVAVVNELKTEAAKGEKAEDERLAKLIDGFVELVPAGVSAVVSTFASPILAGVVGPITKFVLGKLPG